MTPEGTDEEDNSVGSWLRKKSRRKKVRDKWNSLYFVPFEVINQRKTLEGLAKKGPRGGVQLYKELHCRECGQVFHSRHNQHTHTRRPEKVAREGDKRERASAVYDICEEITIEDEEEDSEVTCIDPESPLPVSSELESLCRTSLIQPEVSLSLSLKTAIRREDKERENLNLSQEICNIKEKLVALFSNRQRQGQDRGVKKAVSGWSKILKGKGTKRQNDPSKPTQSPCTETEKAVQSPARKKPFRPVSLLHKFNEAVTGVVSEESPTKIRQRKVRNKKVHHQNVLPGKNAGAGHIDIVTLDEEVTEDIVTFGPDNTNDNDIENGDLILVEDSDEERGSMNISEDYPPSPRSEGFSFLKKVKLSVSKKMSTPRGNEDLIDFIDVF